MSNLTVFDILSKIDDLKGVKVINIFDKFTCKEETFTSLYKGDTINYGDFKVEFVTPFDANLTEVMKFTFKYKDFFELFLCITNKY